MIKITRNTSYATESEHSSKVKLKDALPALHVQGQIKFDLKRNLAFRPHRVR